MEKKNHFVLERLLGILFGVCVTLIILPTFQELNEVAPLQEIALVVGFFILIGMGIISWRRSKLQNKQ
ncbi:MAG: hypothetical protein KAS15_05110 [Nanoarchaeota archaeon]|nr:hypothetical protein [Nanoarchaeota archaeon]